MLRESQALTKTKAKRARTWRCGVRILMRRSSPPGESCNRIISEVLPFLGTPTATETGRESFQRNIRAQLRTRRGGSKRRKN
jgi:hypothetical protein